MPVALYALTAGAFGIGVTEFVIMGLLLEVSADLGVSIPAAGLLISGYALGVVVGAPLLGAIAGRWSRKTLLMGLMVVFTIGNLACALAPDYWTLMAARVLTAFAHASFFGVGSVVATGLVPENRKASAIAVMFTGLTVATILGVPFGTWLGQAYGWRSTFWAVTLVGLVALAVIALLVPNDDKADAAAETSEGALAVLARPTVLLGLLAAVFSWIGVFAAFTYIAPILTRIGGFSEAAVSPILLVFGGGLLVGNLLGGPVGGDSRHGRRDPQPACGGRIDRPVRRGGLRDGGAAADVGAGKGVGRRTGARLLLQHRRLQPGQRNRGMARRLRHRPRRRARGGPSCRGRRTARGPRDRGRCPAGRAARQAAGARGSLRGSGGMIQNVRN
jgi:multidrug resistance protein